MKIIDLRFNTNFIKSLIGKKFIKYKCEQFFVCNCVARIIDIFINNKKYNLLNFEEFADYFGIPEDVAIFKFQEKTPDFEFLNGNKYTDTPINLT